MAKQRTKNSKQLKDWFDNHPFWVILSIIFFVLSLAIAFGTVASFTTSYLNSQVLWKSVEQNKIDQLAPTQTVDFFNSLLGEPNVKSSYETYDRYIYKERAYWIEVFANKSNIVILFDITACGVDGFYPKITNNPVGGELTLGETKMAETTFEQLDDKSLQPHYFLRGATAPSYYYDEYYLGNPSNYQTVFTGHNELCGYLKLPEDIEEALYASPNSANKLNVKQIQRIRKNTTINTFAISSPSFDLKHKELDNIGDGGLGVSYIDEGVLMPNRRAHFNIDNWRKDIKDFEVDKFNQ